MGRRRIIRTPEEQEIFNTNQRLRRLETQRRRREAEKQRRNEQFEQRRDLEQINNEDYLGTMNFACQHCGALHFADEKVANMGLSFNDCCSHGAAILKPLPEFPPALEALFKNEHEYSREFFTNIRHYNNSCSFASFNANLVDLSSQRRGPYCFKIQGQVYYQINTALYPSEDESPTYGQLFIIDQQEALHHRIARDPIIDYELTLLLDTIIRNNNIFAKSFEIMKREITSQQVPGEPEPELQLLFSVKKGQDMRRYNEQRITEVAAIFTTTADGEIPESYVTIRNKNTKRLEIVNSLNSNVEPWIYPLFYPYGTVGWSADMPSTAATNSKSRKGHITRNAYTKSRIAFRPNEFNPFLLGRRLYQQWIVDSYVKVERENIQWVKNNQKKLRADSYKGLNDYLQNAANDMNGHVGKTVILPSTFIGSPRHMQQCYQDAMAIVSKTGKPDIFLTMTCNPNWKEIQENLLPGQEASDRPELVARVFHLKKKRLLHKITKENFFGVPVAHVDVVEFQKRGLPHVHLLITLARGYKITTADIVDKYICAEIPDESIFPTRHQIVMQNMIHGPCGDWCLKDNKCSKNFPKSFENETTLDQNGYPHYRRRNTQMTYDRPNGHTVDNRWVVPYCPQLLDIFNCHMNVEVVSSIKAVKYLYKYIYKGHDAANVVITDAQTEINVIDHDEAKSHIDSRYVGPVEAAYRILSKELQNKSHSITRLTLHLPNEQCVYIPENPDEAIIAVNMENSSSMLLDYFKLNRENETARRLFYSEIPTQFTYKKKNKDEASYWTVRKNNFNNFGRMYAVSPTQTELFHLRLLLLHVKGGTSFEDLRTVDGIFHDSFAAACLARGLIEDDDEWFKAMEEATVWMMPQRLRLLFVRILIHCQPIYPERLWDRFKDPMSDDFSRYNEKNISHQMAYSCINDLLNKEGKSLADFPTMEQSVPIITSMDNNLHEGLQNESEIGARQYSQLNNEQKIIVDEVLNAARNESENQFGTKCIFVKGQGGSGKTFLYETIYHILKSENINVSSMAYTGIASILLPKGKTVHKTFGLQVPLFYDSSSNITAESKEAQILRETKVFIWDEAPMAPRHALEIVDRTLKSIMNNDLPFGGKIMVLGGDFRQLLPIRVNGTRAETVNLSIKNSVLWKNFTTFELKTNMRVLPEELEFAKFLIDVGDGILNDQNDCIEIPEHCIIPENGCIVREIFGKLIEQKKFDEMSQCAILSARNIDVDEINEQVTNLLDASTERIYSGIDSTQNCDNGEMNEVLLPEYLNSLNPSSLPPHKLRLRKYCIVMLIRNISINEGLCNGTRLQVIDFSNHLLKCKVLTGDNRGSIVFLNRITLYSENEYPFSFSRRQFPVKLAFAMTINKAQGQTFRKIGIDLRRDVFSHGHLYVALSRVRSWSSLKIYLGNQRTNRLVKNYVYKELYQ